MKQRKLWMMAAILTSGLSLSSCQDWVTTNDDNPVNPETGEPTNIVENSDFSSYMDVNTRAPAEISSIGERYEFRTVRAD